jgi:choline dehydrogenase-like flavoprotein
MALVDSELRMHGFDGLHLIEASAVTATNPNAPTIMIAETGATRQRLPA